jgi:hypothetical protein
MKQLLWRACSGPVFCSFGLDGPLAGTTEIGDACPNFLAGACPASTPRVQPASLDDCFWPGTVSSHLASRSNAARCRGPSLRTVRYRILLPSNLRLFPSACRTGQSPHPPVARSAETKWPCARHISKPSQLTPHGRSECARHPQKRLKSVFAPSCDPAAFHEKGHLVLERFGGVSGALGLRPRRGG